MTKLSIKERVANGAAWLDKVVPGWERSINLSHLDLNSSCRCILGQVVMAGVEEDTIDHDTSPPMVKTQLGYSIYPFFVVSSLVKNGWAADNGFDIYCSKEEGGYAYGELEEEWIDLIKSRHEIGEFSDGI